MRFHHRRINAAIVWLFAHILGLSAMSAFAGVVKPLQTLDAAEPTVPTERAAGERWVYRFHPPLRDRERKYLTWESAFGVWSPPAISWRYNDAGRPASAPSSASATIERIQAAMAKWSAVCGVTFTYFGTSTAVPRLASDDPPTNSSVDGVNVIGWFALGTGSQTGVAGIGGNGSAIVEGDVAFNSQYTLFNLTSSGGANIFDATAVHEIGHMIGLKHSNVQGAVMSGPNFAPDPSTNYTGLGSLTQDDIDGCRSMYGSASASTPSIAGTAQLNGGGNVAQGTQLCFSGSSAVSACTVGANGQFNCAVPSGWTGTVHLQAGNSRRVAAKRYTTAITSANINQDFTVYDANDYSCNLDIDNNGLNEAAVDGAMILRKLAGLTGTAQSVSNSGACAQRTTANERADFLDAQNYDIGGGAHPLRDGLILSRLMRANASGQQVVQGSQAVNETDLTWSSVQSNISGQCGVSFQ